MRASDSQQLCPNHSDELVDLWNHDRPARGMNNSAHCAPKGALPYPTTATGEPDPACTYEDALFLSRVVDTISAHDVATPLFFFWAAHAVHTPLQERPPGASAELSLALPGAIRLIDCLPFAGPEGALRDVRSRQRHAPTAVRLQIEPSAAPRRICACVDGCRYRYLSMVHFLDAAVGNVTGLLKRRGTLSESRIRNILILRLLPADQEIMTRCRYVRQRAPALHV